MNDEIKKKEVPFITPEAAEMMWTKLKMTCLTKVYEKKPKFQLRNNDECPLNLKGECNECSYFMGASSEDGLFHASGVYDGYCDTKKNKSKSSG